MAALTYRYVALTDTGLRRADNEDSGYASDRLLVIADGMGGAAAGEIASSETLNVIRQLDRDLDVDAIDALDRAVNDANKRLAQIIARDPSVEGMGTTLDALLWDGEKFAFAHIGDSRVYRLRGGELQQLSTDHTFVQSLIDEGRISPAEARVHPHRSLILRAMLGRDDNGADISWVQPVLGDRYLLCSDGLSDMVEDAAIQRALGAETIDMAATDLVRLALEGGGVDNVTVVIAEFVEKGTDPDEHLSSHDGLPQLVGAAASQPRSRTGEATGGDGSTGGTDDGATFDPEELRYAPRPPSRRRWIRWTLGIVVLAAILAGAGSWAYQWSQDQFYVSSDDGKVAVFRGVQANIPGLTLSHVDETTDIELTALSEFQRREIEDGIEASSKADALETISELDVAAPPVPAPTTPAPTTPAPTTPAATTPPAAAANAAWRR